MYEESYIWTTIVIASAVIIGIITLLLYNAFALHNKKLYYHSLILRHEIDAIEEERIRIARDLHDDLGQQLAYLKVLIGALPELSADRKDEIEAPINTAITKLQSISHNLYPSILERYGLIEAINQLATSLKEHYAVNISVDLDAKIEDRSMQLQLYRIFQETFHNAIKHSRCTLIYCSTYTKGNYLFLLIKDDGIGFHIPFKSSSDQNGINNIKARVNILKGKIQIFSKKRAGVTYQIKIPLANE